MSLMRHKLTEINLKMVILKNFVWTFRINVKLKIDQNYFLDQTPYYCFFILDFLW